MGTEEGSKLTVENVNNGDVEAVKEIHEETVEQPKSESVTVKVPCIISSFKFGGK